MNVQEMAAKILKIVEGYQPTTFAELHRHIGAEMEGEYVVRTPGHPNLILWTNVNETFIGAMNAIKDKLFPTPVSEMLYMMDGEVLELPIARGSKEYTTPHWVPISLAIRTPKNQIEMDKAVAKRKQAR